ncbi:cytochrome P450 [Kribbella sp. NPDC023855]|uniref:cytochrome P450 n=1 Tax=Kribbella sp. NPDC023855 TaxID=3154698 RepID=UPI0033F2BCD3
MNLLGNGLHALLQNPHLLDKLRADPDALPNAVEELLRFDSPVDITAWRYATEAVQVGDVTISSGDPVLISLCAANRDPAAFAGPDRVDVNRQPTKHLAFGFGTHYCLGAPLARLQGEVAFAAVLPRFHDMGFSTDPEELRWRSGLLRRGLEHLPVSFRPTSTDGSCPVVAAERLPTSGVYE